MVGAGPVRQSFGQTVRIASPRLAPDCPIPIPPCVQHDWLRPTVSVGMAFRALCVQGAERLRRAFHAERGMRRRVDEGEIVNGERGMVNGKRTTHHAISSVFG